MTTIAYRDGIMASDSRVTVETEAGGIRHFRCQKLFRVTHPTHGESIIATAGESAPGLVFVDWYASGNFETPEILVHGEADFTCLVLDRRGLYEYDKWCRGEKIMEKFYAIGSGCKAALGAMHMGASAEKAVAVACRVDTLSAPSVVVMALGTGLAQRRADALARPKRARQSGSTSRTPPPPDSTPER